MEFDVKLKDTSLGEHADVIVMSKKPFSSDELQFSKTGKNIYKATLFKTGFIVRFVKFFRTETENSIFL